MPTYKNSNNYKVSLKKPDGTVLYLLPNQSMQLSAFYDQYRKKGMITLVSEKSPTRMIARSRKEKVQEVQATDRGLAKATVRLAVCISGRAIDSQYAIGYIKSLKRAFAVDVYAHVWKEAEEITSNSWSKSKNDPNNTDRTLTNLTALDATILQEDFRIKNQDFMRLHRQIKHVGANVSRADTGVISMFYSIHKANELRRASGIRHDLVVRMRYDSEPKNDLDLAILNTEAINIPNEEDFAGINDQFAIGPPSMMDVYCGVYENIVGLSLKCTHHPELLLRCQLDAHQMPINRINYRVLIGRNRGS